MASPTSLSDGRSAAAHASTSSFLLFARCSVPFFPSSAISLSSCAIRTIRASFAIIFPEKYVSPAPLK